jgi:formate hydrogenlyase subunit 7
MLAYLLKTGVVTSRTFCPPLEEGVRGLPQVTPAPCSGLQCSACQEVCPTDVIRVSQHGDKSNVSIDLGGCIGCGMCTAVCPTGTIIDDKTTKTARLRREDLVIRAGQSLPKAVRNEVGIKNIFRRSIAIRVVSTGCSACDLEIGASGNPIFDMERFGVHVVASPRFADVLLVTGPVPRAMHAPLRRCYEAMSDPRLVVAVGTCAISGGVHRGGYADADGVDKVIPVQVYIPGCPPHPWSIIYGVHLAMNIS